MQIEIKKNTESFERERIARNLHDVVGNELLHFQFMFLKLEHNIDKETFVKMSDRLNFIRNQIRNISHNLVKPYLENSSDNLIEQVKFLLIDYTYLFPNVRFDFNHFPKFISITDYDYSQLLIILNELINNAILHGCPETIDINLTEHEQSITLIIEDNGIGFDLKKNSILSFIRSVFFGQKTKGIFINKLT